MDVFIKFSVYSLKDIEDAKCIYKHLYESSIICFYFFSDLFTAFEEILVNYYEGGKIDDRDADLEKLLDFINVLNRSVHMGMKNEIKEMLSSKTFRGCVDWSMQRFSRIVPFDSINSFVKQAKIVLYFLNKAHYFNSDFYKNELEELRKECQFVIIVLTEEFEFDAQPGDIVFHLYKHETENYEGFELRRMLSHIGSVVNKRLEIGKKYKQINRVFLSFDKETDTLNEIMRELTNLDLKYWSKMSIKCASDAVDETLDSIEKSMVVVCLVTNKYLESSEFQRDIEYSRRMNKIVIPVLLEEIDGSNSNLLFALDDFKTFDTKDIKYLYLMISRILWRLDSRKEVISVSKRINMIESGMDIKYGLFLNNKLVLGGFDMIYFYDNRTFKLQKMTSLYDIITGRECLTCMKCCYIEHLKLICLGDEFNLCLFVLNHNFEFIREISINGRPVHGWLNSIEYSHRNNKTYVLYKNVVSIYDEKLNAIELKNMVKRSSSILKIIESRVFIVDSNLNEINVFDLSLNFLHTISCFDGLHAELFSMQIFSGLLIIYTHTMYTKHYEIHVIDTQNYAYCEKKEIELFDDPIAIDNVFIVKAKTMHTDVYEICRNKNITLMQSDVICKISPYNQHLFRDPYVFPCCNSACLDCIYDCFNIFTDKIKCNFSSCQQEHSLNKFELVEDTKLVIMMNGCLQENLKTMIQFEKRIVDDLVLRFYDFESRFDTLEIDLEIRIESLKNKIDEIAKCFTEEVNVFLEKLKYRKKKKKCSGKIDLFVCEKSVFMKSSNVGKFQF